MVSNNFWDKNLRPVSNADAQLRTRGNVEPNTGPGVRRIEPGEDYSKRHEADRAKLKAGEAAARSDDYARTGSAPKPKTPNKPLSGRR